MDDFSKGGVHKTDDFWWVMFSKGGVQETDGFWWALNKQVLHLIINWIHKNNSLGIDYYVV